MADIVTVQTIADIAGVKHVSKMTNLSDGTGESLVTKIDASNTNGMTEDATKVLARIWYSINATNTNAAVSPPESIKSPILYSCNASFR